MKEMNEKLSMWARLYKRWEQVDPDPHCRPPTFGESGTGMSAMEVELRALQAKADVGADDLRAAPGTDGRR